MSTENVKTEGYVIPELLTSMMFLGENPRVSYYFYERFFEGLVKNPPKNFLAENVKREWFEVGKANMEALMACEPDPCTVSKSGFGSRSSYRATAAIAALLQQMHLRLEHLNPTALTVMGFVGTKWKFILNRSKDKIFPEYNRVYPNHTISVKQFDMACVIYAMVNKQPHIPDAQKLSFYKDCEVLVKERKRLVKYSTDRFVQQVMRERLVFCALKDLTFMVDVIRAAIYHKTAT